jgi:hypothetical protein
MAGPTVETADTLSQQRKLAWRWGVAGQAPKRDQPAKADRAAIDVATGIEVQAVHEPAQASPEPSPA